MPEKRKRVVDENEENDENDEEKNDPSEIGSGSFGTIHLLDDNDDPTASGGGKVVTKKCTFQKRRPDLPVPFLREYIALKTIGNGHVNVVNAFDFDLKKRTFCMERLSGSLFHYLHRVGQLSEDAAVNATLQIARGVSFLHDRGIIHRDLSSNNILVDTTAKDHPRFVIGDFGTVVKSITGREMTTLVTTIPFRAPEMMFGSRFYGKPIDVWALGMLAIEMIHGKCFIHRGTNKDQLIRTFFLTGVPSESNWPDASKLPSYTKFEPMMRVSLRVNEGTEKLIKWLMTLDPDRRPLASEVVERLNSDDGVYKAAMPTVTTPHTSRANAMPQTKTNNNRKTGWVVCKDNDDDVVLYRHTGLTANYHRAKVVDYLVANAYDLSMSRLALHNAVGLLDAYMALKDGKLPREKLQHLSLACLLVAAKLFDVKDLFASEVAADTGTTIEELVDLEGEVMVIASSSEWFGFDTILPYIDNDAVSKSVRTDSASALGYLTDFSLLLLKPDFKSLAASVKCLARGERRDDDNPYCTELHRLLGKKPMKVLERDGPFAMGRHVIVEEGGDAPLSAY